MNDFTKEELQNLFFYVQVVPSYHRRDGYNALMEKIQFMIDNYDKQKPAIVFVRGESRDISEFYDE